MLKNVPQGNHVVLDIAGAKPDLLRDGAMLMRILMGSLRETGLTILDRAEHQFHNEGGGFTGMLLLAESHATIHTFPEHGYVAIDIFTCGNHDLARIIQSLVSAIGGSPRVRTLTRGIASYESANA